MMLIKNSSQLSSKNGKYFMQTRQFTVYISLYHISINNYFSIMYVQPTVPTNYTKSIQTQNLKKSSLSWANNKQFSLAW